MREPSATNQVVTIIDKTKPFMNDLKQFIKLSSKPGIRSRASTKQKNYYKFMSEETFGSDEMICTVDRVIMSCELWWIQHNTIKNFDNRFIFEVLNQLFKLVNYNNRNSDGNSPLIPESYLCKFLEHSTTPLNPQRQGKDGKETFAGKYCKMFRKAVQAQHTWIFELFLHSSRYTNFALHNFVLGRETCIFCPYINCLYCEDISRDSIYGFSCSRYMSRTITSSLKYALVKLC